MRWRWEIRLRLRYKEAAMIRRYDAPQKAEEKKEKKTKDSGEVKKPAETKMQGGPSENK